MENSEPRKISSHILALKKSIGLPDQQMPETISSVELTEGAKIYFEKLSHQNISFNQSYDQVFQMVKNSGYEIDSENETVVKKLCLYISGDERMQEFGLNPKKGIALLGGLGVGKTMLMKILRYNSRVPYGFINCSTIADQAEHGGSHEISRHFRSVTTNSPHLYFGRTEIGFCFNELGREQIPVKYMGNIKNIMELIFFNRYENEVPHNFTHFTSNKSVDELGQLYGDYIRDRMREMFNVVYFPQNAKSRRK